MSKIHEQLERNSSIALKATCENKKKVKEEALSSSKRDDSDSDDDEDMALFVKRFKKVIKMGYLNKDKKKSKTIRKSNKPCFGCGKVGHFVADCPTPRKREEQGKSKKKSFGKALLGLEWDSIEEISDSEDERVATLAMEVNTSHTSLSGDITDDEDDHPPMCLMARGTKVLPKPSSCIDDEDDVDEMYEKLVNELGKKAAKKIMKLVAEIEKMDEALETQEELVELERKKIVGLEKSLSQERKSFKMQEDLLKAKGLFG
ncbi:unnamed protein product [Urochloa humidicola]